VVITRVARRALRDAERAQDASAFLPGPTDKSSQ
jgi:hypothetical protein